MKPTMTTADIAQLAGVTRRHATGQIVKRPGFPAPCINASQRLRAHYTTYFKLKFGELPELHANPATTAGVYERSKVVSRRAL